MKYLMKNLQVLVTIKIWSKVLLKSSPHAPSNVWYSETTKHYNIHGEHTLLSDTFGEDIVTSLLIKTKTEAPPMKSHYGKHQNQRGNTRKKNHKEKERKIQDASEEPQRLTVPC